jgi:hypothetical protein
MARMKPETRPVILTGSMSLQSALAAYEAAGPLPIVIAYDQAAQLFAEHFYQFLEVAYPSAAVLIRANVGSADLNRLSCPFLLVQEQKDEALEAVHHHEMRYGDGTDVIPGDGAQESTPESDVRVHTWLERVLKLQGRRLASGASLDDRKDQSA